MEINTHTIAIDHQLNRRRSHQDGRLPIIEIVHYPLSHRQVDRCHQRQKVSVLQRYLPMLNLRLRHQSRRRHILMDQTTPRPAATTVFRRTLPELTVISFRSLLRLLVLPMVQVVKRCQRIIRHLNGRLDVSIIIPMALEVRGLCLLTDARSLQRHQHRVGSTSTIVILTNTPQTGQQVGLTVLSMLCHIRHWFAAIVPTALIRTINVVDPSMEKIPTRDTEKVMTGLQYLHLEMKRDEPGKEEMWTSNHLVFIWRLAQDLFPITRYFKLRPRFMLRKDLHRNLWMMRLTVSDENSYLPVFLIDPGGCRHLRQPPSIVHR
jgi:hypothetical protein